MLKGCEKRIYYMKNPPGHYFEEAYLIMRRDFAEKNSAAAQSSRELAAEAERIIRDASAAFAPVRPSRIHGRIVSFVLGAAASSALIGGTALILGLV